MQKRVLGFCCLTLLFALARALPALAQGGESGNPPEYTYVAEWAVPRDQWRDMAKVTADEKATMEKLLTDGTIVSYGDFSNLLHQEGQPTHGSWFSATSIGNLLRALEAIYKLPQVTFPVLAASKHWDYMMVSHVHNARSGNFKGGYLAGGAFDVKPGHSHEFHELIKNNIVPIMEKLLADGAVISYSVEKEEFHSEKPGRVTLVYTTADAAGVDKVEGALDSAFNRNPALEAAFSSAVEHESHRDFLARIGNMVNK
jgi:hypothetical protein